MQRPFEERRGTTRAPLQSGNFLGTWTEQGKDCREESTRLLCYAETARLQNARRALDVLKRILHRIYLRFYLKAVVP
jgi:hypothetical protein